jgi:hypothetical protein
MRRAPGSLDVADKGGYMSFERRIRLGSSLAALAASAALLSGCGATINHTYDPVASFGGLKSYAWATASMTTAPYYHGHDSALIVKNVEYEADQLLEKKGFTKATGKPDFLITMSFDCATGLDQYGWELRMLALQVQTADSNQPLWQGSATAKINADAATGNLRQTVEQILASFPPKK